MIWEALSLRRSPSQQLAHPPNMSRLEVRLSYAQAVSSLGLARWHMVELALLQHAAALHRHGTPELGSWRSRQCLSAAGMERRSRKRSRAFVPPGAGPHLPAGGLQPAYRGGVLQTLLPQSKTSTVLRYDIIPRFPPNVNTCRGAI